MMRLRRFAPLFTAFFAVNVAVRVAGAACVMPGMSMAAPASVKDDSSAMAGMNEMASSSQTPNSSGDRAPDESPCDAPGVPGNCAALASCGNAPLDLARVTLETPHPAHSQPAVLLLLAPASHTRLPELPPPRA